MFLTQLEEWRKRRCIYKTRENLSRLSVWFSVVRVCVWFRVKRPLLNSWCYFMENDHMIPVTRCDQGWPGVTRCLRCDQLWPQVIGGTRFDRGEQIWPIVTGVTRCAQVWPDMIRCGHMWLYIQNVTVVTRYYQMLILRKRPYTYSSWLTMLYVLSPEPQVTKRMLV